MIRIGVDEAGRGCIIGPMVVAGVAIDEERLGELRRIGVRDSKRLSKKKREKLFWEITELSEGLAVTTVQPSEIDARNLNEVTYDAVIRVIRVLNTTGQILTVAVDKVGNETRVAEEIQKLGLNGIIEYHADENIMEVSAASIIAKVCRDSIIEELRSKFGNFGSGYPSDKRTIEWLKSNITVVRDINIVRLSWKTLQSLDPNLFIQKGREKW